MTDAQTILLMLVLSATAMASPFALRFDTGGLGSSGLAERGRKLLFLLMSLVFSTGFVALSAAGGGAILGTDGIEAMMPLAWVWAPILLLATGAAARRGFGGRAH